MLPLRPSAVPSPLPTSVNTPPVAGKPPVLSVNPHVPALLAYAQLAAQQVGGPKRTRAVASAHLAARPTLHCVPACS